ncbi:hypothetical protein BDQ12DRAFT_681480 [Crucibulum laeve]|uniref:Uncharacterized protein n=1 Tax=Crucibulum laeve TaxID=68775 RepID=A0A5C3M6C9_9AGAR|nr:hypothetical protein BDQ12DRAFT_681480 [Crucibulum laeve]
MVQDIGPNGDLKTLTWDGNEGLHIIPTYHWTALKFLVLIGIISLTYVLEKDFCFVL